MRTARQRRVKPSSHARSREIAPAVLYEKRGAVAVVSLNRPHVHNAYNMAMRDGLFDALGAVRDDPEVRALLLRGNGPSFCSGGDVAEFGAAPSIVAGREARWRRDVWGLLRRLAKPVVTAAHGRVVGGGLEMIFLSDLCVAASNALFWYPETGLGMIPGVAGTQTTPRLLGSGVALDLILRGTRLRARDAQRLGFVNRVVAPHLLASVSETLARCLAGIPAPVAAGVKRAVNDGLDLRLPDALALEKRLVSTSGADVGGRYRS